MAVALKAAVQSLEVTQQVSADNQGQVAIVHALTDISHFSPRVLCEGNQQGVCACCSVRCPPRVLCVRYKRAV